MPQLTPSALPGQRVGPDALWHQGVGGIQTLGRLAVTFGLCVATRQVEGERTTTHRRTERALLTGVAPVGADRVTARGGGG